MSRTVLIATGSYSSIERGRGRGVELLSLEVGDHADGHDTALTVSRRAAVELPDPSFVLWSPDGSLLYAVLETAPTRVVAVRVDDRGETPQLAADLELSGSGGCHLALGRDRSTLVVSDYGSGTVETVRLDADGLPVELIDVDDHHDHADGLDPHPHQAAALPGTVLLAVPDLGRDRVLLYHQERSGSLEPAGEIPVPRGSGPRHLAADHESAQLHISCELSGKVATAVRAAQQSARAATQGLARTVPGWSVTSTVPASGGEGENFVSHLELTADESALLVANRGPDTLSLLSLGPMRPEVACEVEVGAHPRHFTQLGDLVLVAAQEADRIDVLRRRELDLAVAAEPIPSASVSCLAVRP